MLFIYLPFIVLDAMLSGPKRKAEKPAEAETVGE